MPGMPLYTKLIPQYQEGRDNSSALSPLISPALNTQYPQYIQSVRELY